ncbi:hypothetical protein [Enterococcus faecalis]|uniref:hypothetical protein n=1 Tax=Enterococcus TaxID=1350 RepID=UPI000F81248E|nr:hypothetical protein [Enterococcus faecalis]EGO6570115.1 hypothetical protein [Enterococcus faecalis]EGO7756678.1 hypothetical protein [Enterococcus faecalis]EGO8279962.1 hypothetical protein [Enterococcus faecalis]EGO8519994.1 hypothetical protein [Enterococcus faecalis]EHK9404536.1 hypothetical protein [Enterococcus faecalis]
MYDVVKFFVPLLEKYSFWISLIFFITWLVKINSSKYIHSLEIKAIQKHNEALNNVMIRNQYTPHAPVELSSNWIDIYNAYLARRHNSLLLAFIFAYISFNTTSYFRNDSDNFFKLLTISTSLFLAGLTYIQRLYRG